MLSNTVIVPNFVGQQLEAGYPKNFLDSSLLSSARIKISYAKRVEAGVQIKLQVLMYLDANGNLMPMGKTEGSQDKSCPGFASKMIVIRPENAMFSADEYQALLNYADRIAKYEELNGQGSFGKDGQAKKLWLAVATNDAQFQFNLEDRVTPATGNIVAGLTQVAWKGMKIMGVGSAEELATFVEMKPMAVKPLPVVKAAPVAVAADDDFDI